MKKTIGVMHCIATCEDCGKEFTAYKNAQALAAQHAKKYRHLVRGEIGLVFEYNGKPSEQPPESRGEGGVRRKDANS